MSEGARQEVLLAGREERPGGRKLLRLALALLIHAAVFAALLFTDRYTYRPITKAFGDMRESHSAVLRRLSSNSVWRPLNDVGEFLTAAVVAVIFWRVDQRRRRLLLILLCGMALACAVGGAAAIAVGRRRPGLWLSGKPQFMTVSERMSNFKDVSLPSGHATAAAALATFLALAYPRLRWLMAFLAVGCALARVRYQKHFLSDVYAGLVWGHYAMLLVWTRLNRPPGKGDRDGRAEEPGAEEQEAGGAET